MIGRWIRNVLFALLLGLYGAAVMADEITIAITLSETDIHQEANSTSAVFARVPKDMRLIVKGREPGWVKISGPGRQDAWVSEDAVRVESRSIERGQGKPAVQPSDPQKPSDPTVDSWAIKPGHDPLSVLTARVDKLEQRVRELEEKASERPE